MQEKEESYIENSSEPPREDDNDNDSDNDNDNDNDNQETEIVATTCQPSTLSTNVSNVTNASKLGIDIANIVTKFTFDTIKLSTKTGTGITKVVTGTVSNSLVSIHDATINAINTSNRDINNNNNQNNNGNDNNRFSLIPTIINTSTNILHKTLTIAEDIASFGLDLTSGTVQYSLETTSDGISVIENLFGMTDSAKAFQEFMNLIKREWRFDDVDENGSDTAVSGNNRSVNNISNSNSGADSIDTTTTDNNNNAAARFGTLSIMKALIIWAFLQRATKKRWERKISGYCERIRRIDLSNINKDLSEMGYYENIYENAEWIYLEDENDIEMTPINSNGKYDDYGDGDGDYDYDGYGGGSNSNSDSNNANDCNINGSNINGSDDNEVIVGEIATTNNEMLDKKDEDLNNLFIETTKKYNNPYLEEKPSHTIDEKLFTLTHNLKRYSKFSSSAYDFKNTFLSKLPFNRNRRDRAHPYQFSFASETKLPLNSIIDSSHHDIHNDGYHPTYFVIRDRTTSSIILALRGTMSVNDLTVDLSCHYEDFQFAHDKHSGDDGIDDKTYKVHKGIYQAAKSLATPKKSKVFEIIKKELRNNEGYGLVLVGHSLGAGIASMLALLLASPKTCKTTKSSGLPVGRHVHAYAFATPCVMSGDLSKLVIPLVTSVAYRNDFVTRLSIGHILDLRDMIKFLYRKNSDSGGSEENNEELASVIIRKMLGYQSPVISSTSSNEEYEDFFWETSQKIYERMNNVKLYPAGQVYWVVGDDSGGIDGSGDNNNNEREENDDNVNKINNNGNRLFKVNDVEKIFNELRFTPNMMIDHLPYVYETIIRGL